MKKAQSALEYAMVIAVVIAALLTMHFYVQRTVQGKLQLIDEQVETNLPRVAAVDPDITCVTGACSDYTDCFAASGNCPSGTACTGTCGSSPSSPGVIPPGAIPIALGTSQWVNFTAGQAQTYYFDITAGNQTRLSFDLLPVDLTSEGSVTVTFPDGRTLSGDYRYGISAKFDFRSQNGFQPNIPDLYLPTGNYVLTVSPSSSGRVVMQMF